MTWGPLGSRKSVNNRPIPDFLGSDQGGHGPVYPQHERRGYSPQTAENLAPPIPTGYGSYLQPLITVSLSKKSIFFLLLTFMLSVTFAFVIGFAVSFMMFSQSPQNTPAIKESTRVVSKKIDKPVLASNKKKIIIQQEENDLDNEELE